MADYSGAYRAFDPSKIVIYGIELNGELIGTFYCSPYGTDLVARAMQRLPYAKFNPNRAYSVEVSNGTVSFTQKKEVRVWRPGDVIRVRFGGKGSNPYTYVRASRTWPGEATTLTDEDVERYDSLGLVTRCQVVEHS